MNPILFTKAMDILYWPKAQIQKLLSWYRIKKHGGYLFYRTNLKHTLSLIGYTGDDSDPNKQKSDSARFYYHKYYIALVWRRPHVPQRDSTIRATSTVPVTVEQFEKLMVRHCGKLAYIEQNAVEVKNKPSSEEMLEMLTWCQEHVTGAFSKWSCCYLCRRDPEHWWSDTGRLFFYFSKPEQAAIFKLTYG